MLFEKGQLYYCANRILFGYQEWIKPSSYMISTPFNDVWAGEKNDVRTYMELLRNANILMRNMASIHGITEMFIVEPGVPFLLLKHNINVMDHNGSYAFPRTEHLEILHEEKIGYIFPKEDMMFEKCGV